MVLEPKTLGSLSQEDLDFWLPLYQNVFKDGMVRFEHIS